MRLTEISQARRRYGGAIQPLPEGDFSSSVGKNFALRPKDAPRTRLTRVLAGPLLALQSRGNRAQMPAATTVSADYWAMGERYANHASWAALMRRLPAMAQIDVFVPGCYMADEDVQFWLRRKVKSLAGIDIYSLDAHWAQIIPALTDAYGTPVTFKQGSIEDIPFGEAQFDVMVSEAVLEHVRNLDAMVAETHRVLKPGGHALHMFGPLYYSYGADHCISALGMERAYDHLLLDEADYRACIAQRDAFEAAVGNPDLAFWAENDQFSFATAQDYLEAFGKAFEIVHAVAKISVQGLAFRAAHPDKWQALLGAGIPEQDLLIKGMNLLIRRPGA